MKVLICSNCGGFGVTVGPVLRPVCGEGDENGEAGGHRQEAVTYPCQACEGTGFLTVAAGAQA